MLWTSHFACGVVKVEHTKSGRRREIPTNQHVYEVLVALPGEKSEGPVFRKRSGAAWGSIRTGFERACRAEKITGFRFHDLRNTRASWSRRSSDTGRSA